MLNLFQSFRKRMTPELGAMFDKFLTSLGEFSGEQVGDLLDVAKAIKDATIQESASNSYAKMFENPASVSEQEAFRALRLWRHQMISQGRSAEGHAKVAGLMVWYLSLAAAHFPEFASQAASLWRELDRGFDHCNEFVPAVDALEWASS